MGVIFFAFFYPSEGKLQKGVERETRGRPPLRVSPEKRGKMTPVLQTLSMIELSKLFNIL